VPCPQTNLHPFCPTRPFCVLRHYPSDDQIVRATAASPCESRPRDTGLLYTIPAKKAIAKTSHLLGFVKKVGSRVDAFPPRVWSAVARHRFTSSRDIASPKTRGADISHGTECRATLRWHWVCALGRRWSAAQPDGGESVWHGFAEAVRPAVGQTATSC